MEGKPSNAMAGIAAALPLLFAAVACAVIPVRQGDLETTLGMAEKMGASLYATVAAAALAAVVCGLLLFVAGRGKRVPAAVTVGAAALPWLVGIAATAVSLGRIENAAFEVSPSKRASLLAAGISEALGARAVGTWFAAALLAAVGFGLAFAALGQRAPERKIAGAAIGAVAALPLLGLAAYPIVAGEGVKGLALVLPAGAGLVVLALAAAAPGRDEKGRSASLAASASVAMVLAFVATALSSLGYELIVMLGALGGAAGDSYGQLLAAAAGEVRALSWTATWAGLIGLVSVVAVGGWAALKSPPSIGRVVGGVALVLAAAGVVGADRWGQSSAAGTLRSGLTPAWAVWEGLDSFEPLTIRGELAGRSTSIWSSGGGRVAAIVMPEGAWFEDKELALEPDALATRFESALDSRRTKRSTTASGSTPDWLKRDSPSESSPRVKPDPPITVAIDARLSAKDLRTVLEAARNAGANSLWVLGVPAQTSAGDQRARLRDDVPLLAPLAATPQRTVRVLLDTALSWDQPGPKRTLYRGTIGTEPNVRLEPHRGAKAEPVQLTEGKTIGDGLGGEFPKPSPTGKPLAFLSMEKSATAQIVVTAAARARNEGCRPVLGPIPEDVPESTTSKDGSLEAASSSAAGSGLSEETIRRVIERHTNEVRFCYEQELAKDPSLQGKVTVEFTIATDGTVKTASVAESTLDNEATETCIVEAVRRWTFPRPEDGSMTIKYPFELKAE